MDRPTARRLLLVALGIGVFADLMLDGPALGINVPIVVAVCLAAGWFVRRPGRAPDPIDVWLPVTALVLAGFVAVRADPFLALLDAAGAAAFTGASMVAFSGLAVTRRSASVVVAMGAWVMGSVAVGAARVLPHVRRPAEAAPRRVPGWVAPLGRGLFLAVPLVIIFAVLFASADPIFRRGIDELLGIRIDLGDLPGRVLFVVGITWLTAGLLAVATAGIPPLETASLGAAAWTPPIASDRSLGTVEAVTVLIGVVSVVGLFVGLQVAYLFGGLDTMAAAGLTYSDYARRGYFELVAAAGLAGGVLVGLEYVVAHRSRAYVALGIALVALTVLVLASAAIRLQLYQDAYGWTELRLYVAVSIAAMAVTLLALAAFLATDRTRWLGHVMAVTGLVALLAVNGLAPAAFVAQRNVDRVIDPTLVPPDGWVGLDTDYLYQLSDDAIPVLVEALPRLATDDQLDVRRLLEQRRHELANDPALASPAAWNLGRERAKAALSTLP
jgi:hypothetical protein